MRAAPDWRLLGTRLGLFAVLLQAILFGWHHHELHFAGHLPSPVIENRSTVPQPADDDADGCEICQVLHHLTATPVDFTGAAPLLALTACLLVTVPAVVSHTAVLAFRSRAPPALTLRLAD